MRGPVCVVAGAGTGKTRAITHRIAHAVAVGATVEDQVLAVTFTARAAGEMRERLRALGVHRVTARTFHAAALRQLQHSRRIDDETGVAVPAVLGTATALPFADDSFDVVFCSFGALQFVADIGDAVAETARVLRRGGRFAFSITHPTRWMFPDDPGPEGLTASQSYWDRTPYVEVEDRTGTVAYVEHHFSDRVTLMVGEREIVVHDRDLATRILNAAGGN